eukprot:TRINITY_DN16295_c0_g1_i1.p3 TRINITY_DN16295_c0_g1~~TRINITY_DN16295_c0_g1_i1.p3  ORF type:complete len:104 (-),score=6.16 TRINITY_DN16295_c0_g1_i1:403-714(-)
MSTEFPEGLLVPFITSLTTFLISILIGILKKSSFEVTSLGAAIRWPLLVGFSTVTSFKTRSNSSVLEQSEFTPDDKVEEVSITASAVSSFGSENLSATGLRLS